MPRDVAMERPHARIGAVVLHDDIPIRLQHLHIPPLRVSTIHNAPVPEAQAFIQHVHVVAVQMHRVGGRRSVFDNQAHRGGIPRIVDVPFRVIGVGGVADVCEEEQGGVVVGAEGDAVDGPEEVAGAVDEVADCQGDGCGGVGGWGYGVDGCGGG